MAIRKLCREYAEKFYKIQREEFQRLGVLGDWEHPYLTMNPAYEATIVREFGKFVERGGVYKGLEAGPLVYSGSNRAGGGGSRVRRPRLAVDLCEVPCSRGVRLQSLRSCPRVNLPPDVTSVSVVIWTTTPWTLPANQAVCLHPDIDYAFVRIGSEVFIIAENCWTPWRRPVSSNEYRVVAVKKGGEGFEGLGNPATADHRPFSSACSGISSRWSKVQAASISHPGMAWKTTCWSWTTTRRHRPGNGWRFSRRSMMRADLLRRFRNLPVSMSSRPTRHRRARSETKGRLLGPWLAGPFLSPLLALQESCDLSGDGAVVCFDGHQRPAQAGLGRDRSGEMDSALGEGPDQRDDRQPSRLVSLTATGVGRADSGFYLYRLAARSWPIPGSSSISRRSWRSRGRCLVQTAGCGIVAAGNDLCHNAAGTDFEKERDILDVWFESGVSYRGCAQAMPMVAGGPLSGRLGSASGMVPQRVAGRRRHRSTARRTRPC